MGPQLCEGKGKLSSNFRALNACPMLKVEI